MKKLLMLVILLATSTNLIVANGWPAGTKQQAVKTQIRLNCMKIRSTYGLSAPCEIYHYLALLGTPESFEVLKELVAEKILPVGYLTKK